MAGTVDPDPSLLAERSDVRSRRTRRTVSADRFEEMQRRVENGLTWGVGALTADDRGRVLVVRQGGRWYAPGGEVETGESLGEALRREVREETGVRVQIERLVAVTRVTLAHGDSETGFHFAHFAATPEITELAAEPGVADEEITAVTWTDSVPESTVDRDLLIEHLGGE